MFHLHLDFHVTHTRLLAQKRRPLTLSLFHLHSTAYLRIGCILSAGRPEAMTGGCVHVEMSHCSLFQRRCLLPLRRPRAQLGLVLHMPPLRTHNRHATPLLSSVTLDQKTAAYNRAECSVTQGPLPAGLCFQIQMKTAMRCVVHQGVQSSRIFLRQHHGRTLRMKTTNS